MSDHDFDLIIIGAGPGGYIGAIRAAQLGMTVACVEKDATLGGTCLNVGCIPSKALLQSSEHYHQAKHDLAAHGVDVDGVSLNLDKMLDRKNKVVKRLTGGIAYLFKKNGVTRLNGFGRIAGANQVIVKDAEGNEQSHSAARILIATGSSIVTLPDIDVDEDRIVSSTGALSFPEVPEHLVVIGAGVIGLELGSVWSRLGSKVTVLEYMPKILGMADAEVSKTAQRIFKKQGLDFLLEVRVVGAEIDDDEVTVSYEDRKTTEIKDIVCDRLLVCVGRKPFTEGLGLDELGVKRDKRGRILVDENYETNVKGVFAIGDAIPGAMLAHKAEEEGVACVERMNGIAAHINYDAIPDVIYTWPEIAGVGKTEEQLKEAGVDYKKGKFPFAANSRALAVGTTDGFVKILSDARTDTILGAQIIGPHAGDLIAELAVAIEFGASSEDIARSSHAHPTLAEAIKEATLAVDGRSLNS